MSQQGLSSYFSTRKRLRSAIDADDDSAVTAVKHKVLVLDDANSSHGTGSDSDSESDVSSFRKKFIQRQPKDQQQQQQQQQQELLDSTLPAKRDRTVKKLNFEQAAPKKPKITRTRKPVATLSKNTSGSKTDILTLISNLKKSTKTTDQHSDLKEKLKDKTDSQYRDLAVAVESFNQSYQKLKEFKQLQRDREDEAEVRLRNKLESQPELKSFKTIEFEIKSPEKPQTPEKSYLSPKKAATSPALLKRNLLPKFELTPSKDELFKLSSNRTPPGLLASNKLLTPEKHGLVLPLKYRILLELFRTFDNLCSMCHYRKETITFEKIKKSVEEVTRRAFRLQHLEQIAAIYPEAYTYRQELMRTSTSVTVNDKSYQLVITVCFATDEPQLITPSMLMSRAHVMYTRLVERVKRYHTEFLAALDPPILMSTTNGDARKLKRWHPEFNLEHVPDIESFELPKPPAKQFVTARQLLEQSPRLFSETYNSKIKLAIDNLSKISDKTASTTTSNPAKRSELEKNIFDKLPKGLLEKLRTKQTQQVIERMFRNPEHEKEIQMYARLAEIARLTRNIFVSEKKSTLPLDDLLATLTFSYKEKLLESQMHEHLKLMPLLVPQWISFHNVRNVTYVKVDKHIEMSQILLKFHNALENKKKSYNIS